MVYRQEVAKAPKRSSKRQPKSRFLGGRGTNVLSKTPNPGHRPKKGGGNGGFGSILNNAFNSVQESIEDSANQVHRMRPQKVARQAVFRPIPKTPRGGGRRNDGSGRVGGGGPDYLDSLMQSMLTDAASQTFDYESALRQSEAAIRQAYAGEINAIRANNGAARKDTAKARREITAMYNGLAKSYGRDSSDAIKAGNTEAAGMMGLAKQANSTITKDQLATTNQEAQMLKDLGQQETADQIIEPDFENLKKITAENTQHGQRKASTSKELAGADARYFTRGAAGARFEGTGRSADLLSQLQDYVRGNRQQIAQIAGQRSRDIAENKTNVMEAQSEAQAKADAELWDRVQQMANLKLRREDINNDNQLAASKFQYTQQRDKTNLAYKRNLDQARLTLSARKNSNSPLPKNLQNAMRIIQTNGKQKQKLTSVLDGLFGSDPFVRGKVTKQLKNGETDSYDLSPFAAARMAEKAGRAAGLSQADINTLKLAAMASVK